MKYARVFAALLCGSLSFNAYPAGLALTSRDCVEILKRWAADPKSVPKALVDACRDLLSAKGKATPVPNVKPAAGRRTAAADPCAGPGAADSVHCWGPWASLAPAAAGSAPIRVAAIDDPRIYPELAEPFDRSVVNPPGPPPPLGACAPGQPCGFATVVPGTTTRADADQTRVTRFDMNPGVTDFVVDAGGSDPIVSNPGMVPAFNVNPLGQENVRSEVTVGDQESKIIARVYRDADGNIVKSADIWKHGNYVAPDLTNTRSGAYAWGIASSQATLDALNGTGNGISASFAGPMSVDPSTRGIMTVNFGTQPTWTGNWANNVRNFSFDAGGAVQGVNVVSDPAKFSSNVNGSASFVQGVLLGTAGNQSVAHALDVRLKDGTAIKDVGLLNQVSGTAGTTAAPAR